MLSVMGEVRASLDTMGAEQQACVFVFLMSYPLSLGSLLDARGRRIAFAAAVASVLAFMVLTDPWMNAVLLIALGMSGLGVFIAAVYLADYVAGRIALPAARQAPVAAVVRADVQPSAAPTPAPLRDRRRSIRVTLPAKL